jgi:hypothetical protein
MKYADSRNQIRTGDLIAVRKTHGLLPAVTRLVTHSPYTHTAIALWSGTERQRRLLIAEEKASGGFLTPLSQYAEIDFDVFTAPKETLLTIEEVIWETLGAPIGYDFMDLIRIGANRIFDIPLPSGDDDSKVCSALSATMWLKAGWRPYALPSIPAPDDVVGALAVPPRLVIRRTTGGSNGHV